jgi:hypothetical protein
MLFLVHRFLSPWWRWSQVPPKRRFLQEPHGVTTQKTPFFIVTAVKTSNLTLLTYFNLRAELYWSQQPRGVRYELFAHSTAGVVGSNPTRYMDICVVLCVRKVALRLGWSTVQVLLPTMHRIKKLKKHPRPNRRTAEQLMIIAEICTILLNSLKQWTKAELRGAEL